MTKGQLEAGDLMFWRGRVFKVIPNAAYLTGATDEICNLCSLDSSDGGKCLLHSRYPTCDPILGDEKYGLMFMEVTGDDEEIQNPNCRKVEISETGEIRDLGEGRVVDRVGRH